jgi:hypothetical protein
VDGRTTAITLYDLIPLIHNHGHLVNLAVERWYLRKLASMRRAGIWLAISNSSRREACDWLNLPPDKVVNISAAADARFRPIRLNRAAIEALRQRYGLTRPFVMYTGGNDHRKNIDGLINALPASRGPQRTPIGLVCRARRKHRCADGLCKA